jgi:hypothetical protein
MQLYRVKCLKCLRTREFILEHKYEWNLSLVWLFLAIVAFYLNCLDRVVLAHPFWALATFPICFSVLRCWAFHGYKMVQLDFKKLPYVKSNICAEWRFFMSVGIQWTNRKTGKIVTLYQRIVKENSTPGYILYPVSKQKVKIGKMLKYVRKLHVSWWPWNSLLCFFVMNNYFH